MLEHSTLNIIEVSFFKAKKTVVLNPDIFGFNEAAVLVTSRLVAFDYAVIEWLERVIFPCHH